MVKKVFTFACLIIVLALVLQACSLPISLVKSPTATKPAGTPSASDTATPPAAPTAAPAVGATGGLTTGLVVQTADNSVVLVSTDGSSNSLGKADHPFSQPGENSLNGVWATSGAVFALAPTGEEGKSQIFKLDKTGLAPVTFLNTVSHGFGIWPGSPSLVAWDSYTIDAKKKTVTSKLFVANADGSSTRTLQALTTTNRVLAVGRFSQDGKKLYFSREPLGLGGYILFGGRSNLFSLVLADKKPKAKEVLKETSMACVDDLSPDETLVADHCTKKADIRIVNLKNKKVTTITLPKALVDAKAKAAGGAMFSPDGKQLVYAAAMNDPKAEQGWIVLSKDLTGKTQEVIATAAKGDYYRVVAWYDAQTLILQSAGTTPGVWLVSTTGTGLKRLSDGFFLGKLK